MAKIMIFAGTTEGRLLTEAASKQRDAGLEVWVSVATEYGRDILNETVTKQDGINLISGRLDEADMAELFIREQFDYVIDTTHPYALAVTANIARQCEEAGIPRIRVLRAASVNGQTERDAGRAVQAASQPERAPGLSADADGSAKRAAGPTVGVGNGEGKPGIVYVGSSSEAAAWLNQTKGIAFLTTGSKELKEFTAVNNFAERLVARVLPMAGVVEQCLSLGFSGKRLICMQGPFSYELNVAMLRQSKAAYLVTKDSGDQGGFQEKLRAALDLGVTPVVIGRNRADEGISLQDAARLLNERLGLAMKLESSAVASDSGQGAESGSASRESGDDRGMTGVEETTGMGDWFPLFINIKGKKVVVAGGGRIAKRRIRNLMKFTADVTVVALEPTEQVRSLAEQGKLKLLQREWRMVDVEGADCVIAATNDRQVNHAICEECKKRGILVNVADRKEECDFYFPGVVRRGDLTIGITAEGRNHSLAKQAKEAVEEAVEKL